MYCGNNITGKYFCSDECENNFKLSRNYKRCVICGELHNNSYCCSSECFNEYLLQEDNEYSITLSASRKSYISQNYEKICEVARKSAINVDQKSKGLKISAAKKGKRDSGYKNVIEIYDSSEKLVYICKEHFTSFCEKYNLPLRKFKESNIDKRIKKGEFAGWYINKIKRKEYESRNDS